MDAGAWRPVFSLGLKTRIKVIIVSRVRDISSSVHWRTLHLHIGLSVGTLTYILAEGRGIYIVIVVVIVVDCAALIHRGLAWRFVAGAVVDGSLLNVAIIYFIILRIEQLLVLFHFFLACFYIRVGGAVVFQKLILQYVNTRNLVPQRQPAI